VSAKIVGMQINGRGVAPGIVGAVVHDDETIAVRRGEVLVRKVGRGRRIMARAPFSGDTISMTPPAVAHALRAVFVVD